MIASHESGTTLNPAVYNPILCTDFHEITPQTEDYKILSRTIMTVKEQASE